VSGPATHSAGIAHFNRSVPHTSALPFVVDQRRTGSQALQLLRRTGERHMSQFRLLARTRQVTEYSCGACALQTVMCYWGKNVGRDAGIDSSFLTVGIECSSERLQLPLPRYHP
jgi:hypothetical protein